MPTLRQSATLPAPSARPTTRPPGADAAHRPTTTSHVRSDLQGVRGLAVLGVVVYHLRASWLPGGFAGVDVFFVLSGFFITGLLLREIERRHRVDLRGFWARRARRLLPASLLVLVTTVVAGRLMTNPLEAHRIARDGIYATVFGMNWHEAASGLAYGQDPNPSPFQHYWSLGVEEQFYLGWPLLLAVSVLAWRRFGRLTLRRTTCLVTVAAGVPSFLLALRQTVPDQPHAYYGTFGRVWQLALGGLLAAILPAALRRMRPAVRTAARFLGFNLVVVFYLAAPAVASYPGYWSLLPTTGAALLVLAGEPGPNREPVGWLLSSRLGQLGGRYSYSWYLWHWAPLVLLPVALDRPLRIRELGACALGTLLLAVLTFHLLEDPVRRSRRLTLGRPARSLVLGAGLMALAATASAGTLADADRAASHVHVRTADRHVLRPQPAAAAKEEPAVVHDGCQLPITSDRLAPECRYLPDKGHGDVVLVGDSHAGMWFPAVSTVARREGWGLRAWIRTSCPFADVRKGVVAGGEYTTCYRWRADVVKRLLAARPSLVIVADYAQTGLHVTDPRTGAGAPQPRARELFAAGQQRYLVRLRSAGIHVLVIRDVPAFRQAAPDCVLAHAEDLAECSLPQDEAVAPASPDRHAAEQVPGVVLADFTDAFCRHRRCFQVADDILAYRDVNHITAEMAQHLAGRLEAAAGVAMG